jgi:hypothetical protein
LWEPSVLNEIIFCDVYSLSPHLPTRKRSFRGEGKVGQRHAQEGNNRRGQKQVRRRGNKKEQRRGTGARNCEHRGKNRKMEERRTKQTETRMREEQTNTEKQEIL